MRARLTGDALRSLDTLERYNLVDDAWNAVIAGRLRATDLLTFLEGFADEREYAVWQAIVISLRGLGRLLDDDAFAQLQQRVALLVEPALTDLGDPTETESDLVGKLRGLLTGALAVLGDDAATQAQVPRAVRPVGSRTQVPSIPNWWRPPRASSPRPVARTSTSGCSPASVRRRPRRISSATSMHWPSSTAPS